MKPRRKTKAVLKWTASAVSVLMLCVTVASIWWKPAWGSAIGDRASIDNGSITLTHLLTIDECLEWADQQAAIVSAAHDRTPAGTSDMRSHELSWVLRRIMAQNLFAGQLTIHRMQPGFSLWCEWNFDSPGWNAKVPIWMLVVPVASITMFTWRSDYRAHRSARVGYCSRCNYNRHGLPAQSVCPECGVTPMVGSDVQAPSPAEKDVP
jgi:hypothetical protein